MVVIVTVEKRTFISKDKFLELKQYFTEHGTSIQNHRQIIYKYRSDLDFRLIFDKDSALLRLRGARNQDEDLIVTLMRNELDKVILMFQSLGLNIDMKWYRTRYEMNYQDYHITLDETYHYGYVVSIDYSIRELSEREEALQNLTKLFETLSIPITTVEKFNDQYKYYRTNWVDFTRQIDEKSFINS